MNHTSFTGRRPGQIQNQKKITNVNESIYGISEYDFTWNDHDSTKISLNANEFSDFDMNNQKKHNFYSANLSIKCLFYYAVDM